MFDEETNQRLQGLRRDLDARLIIARDVRPAETPITSHHWLPRRVPEDMFYAFPVTTFAGVVICYDIDTRFFPVHPTSAFDGKNVYMKSVVLTFDMPTVSQLNRLYNTS
ncbi:MAG: hypothetical protein ABEI52_12215 [Halobacteriaceae archaeon]